MLLYYTGENKTLYIIQLTFYTHLMEGSCDLNGIYNNDTLLIHQSINEPDYVMCYILQSC